jgi:thymidylate synthase (FAD)
MIEVTYIDHMGSDLTTVNAARVSFGKKHTEFDKKRDAKLIRYLAKHKHISPFGHAFASFHVKAPVFVARQLVKHSYLRWNEVSKRYVDDTPELYTPKVWRGRSADKKQGSDGTWQPDHHQLDGLMGQLKDLYDQMIYDGCAPEQARMVLPQSMMTEWYWSGSLDAFASMCQLRCKPDTQYESRLVADQISAMMGELFPVSWAALMKGDNHES